MRLLEPSRRRKHVAGESTSTSPKNSPSTSSPSSLPQSSTRRRSKSTRRGIPLLYHHRYNVPLLVTGFLLIALVTLSTPGLLSSRTFRSSSTPGLYTPLPEGYFHSVPLHLRRSVCVETAQTSVVRAFRQRHWNVTLISQKASKGPVYTTCYKQANAAVVWTKLIPRAWNESQPWQRHNAIPFETEMSRKASTTRYLRHYAQQQQRVLPFLPESYVLPDDWTYLLHRLTKDTTLRGQSTSSVGSNEPWVVKLSAIEVSDEFSKGPTSLD